MDQMIYLDHNATTPVDPAVLDVMLPYFCQHFGNPSSATHMIGLQAKMAVEKARRQVASSLAARPEDVIFTSGATEANNIAILGLIRALGKGHIITSATEHPAVLKAFEAARDQAGAKITILPVNSYGQVEIEQIENAVQPDTVLASFIAASNEIGSTNPLTEIGRLCRQKGILFHTDATQALGKFPIDVEKMGIDLLSLSAHKIYGPKGVGALYLNQQNPSVVLQPLLFGGGQENGLRSGTLNVSGIVGLGKSCELSIERMDKDNEHYQSLRQAFIEKLSRLTSGFQINGHPEQRILNNIHISFHEGCGSEAVAQLGPIACSTGSACASSKNKASHVLTAIGLDEEMAGRSIRVGFGRGNTREHVEIAAERIAQAFCGQ